MDLLRKNPPVTVYLVRHGEAVPLAVDPERPLSARGREEAAGVGRRLAEKKTRPNAILHSGKARARETARILAEALDLSGAPEAMEGLGPEDDPRGTVRWIEARQTPAMLVGHLPHLGFVAALLTAGDPARPDITFPTAGVCCLERSADGIWRLSWTLSPEDSGPRTQD